MVVTRRVVTARPAAAVAPIVAQAAPVVVSEQTTTVAPVEAAVTEPNPLTAAAANAVPFDYTWLWFTFIAIALIALVWWIFSRKGNEQASR